MKALNLLLLGLCLASPALAADVRYPQAGTPAMLLSVGDDWPVRRDPAGKIIITSPDRAITITGTFVPYDGDLDALAFKVAQDNNVTNLGGPLDAMVSDFDGFIYIGRPKASPETVFRIIAIQVGETHVALFTVAMSEKTATERSWEVDNMIRAIRLARAQP